MDFYFVTDIWFVQDLIRQVVGCEIAQVIGRPASYVIRQKDEQERRVERIIVLPPYGYTANTPDQMNSHDETEFATVEIKGAVRAGKMGFSKLTGCLRVDSVSDRHQVSDLNEPYVHYTRDGVPAAAFTSQVRSAGEPPFSVVKQDGFGFYHNLTNTTPEWLVLKLRKQLRAQRGVNLQPIVENTRPTVAELLTAYYAAVVEHGDNLFTQSPKLVQSVLDQDPGNTLPALGEMLHAYETGNHEACTVFATILKVGARDPAITIEFLTSALVDNTIPRFYAQQLVEKIQRSANRMTRTS